jgi:hypothetical protein
VPVLAAASAAVAWFALLVRTWQLEFVASVPVPTYAHSYSCKFTWNRRGLRLGHLRSCFR